MKDIRFGDSTPGIEWHKIRQEGECWVWEGKVRATGQPANAHRILLEAATGVSYHKSKLLCSTLRCVNPRHRKWCGELQRPPYWVCKAENCLKPVDALGMCSTHYSRHKRGQPEEPPKQSDPRKGVCSWRNCHLPARSNALCNSHYRRSLSGKDMDRPVRATYGPRTCSVAGCERLLEAKGLCSPHYQRFKIGADLTTPIPERIPPREVGETFLNEEGYKMLVVLNKDGRKEHVREHRHVMEEHIGRKLYPKETVHHLNGVRDDNRIENLELWSSSHPPGQRVVDKIAWAKELLEQYEGH